MSTANENASRGEKAVHLKWFGIPRVFPYTRPYRKRMALMLFLKSETALQKDTEFRLKQTVKDGIVAFVDAEKESMMSGAELSRRLNLLDRVTMELTEKLDRAPTADEVAELLKMDVGDVRYLMGIALSAINKD